MRRVLLHCGKKIATEAVYTLRNFETFSQLFLFVGNACPHCRKTVMGHAGFDIWGNAVQFPPDQDRFAMAGKKATAKYAHLIETGIAQKVQTVPKSYRHQRGGLTGLSEFSRRAAQANSHDYVLHLCRVIARNKHAQSHSSTGNRFRRLVH